MKDREYTIRREKETDYFEVENLIRESFWNVYRPGCVEHYLMHLLRKSPDFVKELDFVMETDGRIIGQIAFVKACISEEGGKKTPVLTMGPICIANEYKRQGYGKALLDYSLEKAAVLGHGAVLIEGDVAFYGKCGFTFASRSGIKYHDLPDGADSSFFLCKELKDGYLDGVNGEYQTPSVYFVTEEAADEFDKNFPHKEKLKLPGQLF